MNRGRIFLYRVTLITGATCLCGGHVPFNKSPDELTRAPQEVIVSPLGKNRTAQVGSWLSLGLTTALGSFLTYSACNQFLDSIVSYLPFLRSYHEKTAKIAALTITVPLSLIALMKYGPLANYFFYILYAGERVSPLLARDALHDVRVYVQHLQTLKSVQKELYEVIAQIDQLSIHENSATKSAPVRTLVDASALASLEHMIQQNDAYIHSVLEQLQQFLTSEEMFEVIQDMASRELVGKAYCIASELQNHTQAVITQLQTTVHSIDDDACLLNKLMQDLVAYWQRYTIALAEGIDAAVQFCNEVHMLEQIVAKWLDRSLLCV